MELTIARPKEQHAETIASICSAGWKQTVEGKLSEAAQQQTVAHWYNLKRVREDIRKGDYTHVALCGEAVAGVIGGAMTGPQTGEVFVLYVDESLRYKGIGRQLLEVLTREQLQAGAAEQWVSVQEDNQYGIPFYEARGFTFRHRQVTELDGGEQQVSLRYWRPLV